MPTATRRRTRKPQHWTASDAGAHVADLLAAARAALPLMLPSPERADLQAAIETFARPEGITMSPAKLAALVNEMGSKSYGLVSLADLRQAAGVTRSEFDSAFVEAYRQGLVSTAALESTRDLKPAQARRLVDGQLQFAGEMIGYAVAKR
jgi:hypothetical protein